jgi:hypothetical protein
LDTWRAEKEKQDQGSIQIRVITPSDAQPCSDLHDLPFLHDGARIPLSTTLRQLKEMIATQFGLTIQFPSALSYDECNCALAKNIATHGVWDMLRCREPRKEGEIDPFPRDDVDVSKECLICSAPLYEMCAKCIDEPHNKCPLVINAGCEHIFHRDCFVHHRGNNCPGGCSTGTASPLKLLISRCHAT